MQRVILVFSWMQTAKLVNLYNVQLIGNFYGLTGIWHHLELCAILVQMESVIVSLEFVCVCHAAVMHCQSEGEREGKMGGCLCGLARMKRTCVKFVVGCQYCFV